MCDCTHQTPFGCRNLYLCGCSCHDTQAWGVPPDAVVPADEAPEPDVSAPIKAFIDRLELKEGADG